MSPPKYNVVIVDDHHIYQVALESIIERNESCVHKATFSEPMGLLAQFDFLKPNLIFMDIEMPTMNGMEASQIILEKYPFVQIIAISLHAEGWYVKQMLEIGAMGYITKDSSASEFDELFDSLKTGEKYISSKATFAYNLYLNGESTIPNSIKTEQLPLNSTIDQFGLTNREILVMRMVATGLSDKQIADKLSVSHRTINAHKRNIRAKTGAENSASMTLLAFRSGMIT